MALNNRALTAMIVTQLEKQGFETTGEDSKAEELAEAIATAVVSHITASAEVTVAGGSSAGKYKVA